MTDILPFAAILLAGGSGSRMRSAVPKQFLPLGNQLVIQHSIDAFLSCPGLEQLVIVCGEPFRGKLKGSDDRVQYAQPGSRRQDSVYNGLQEVKPHLNLVCVHDGARPFISHKMILDTLQEAHTVGAATTAMPISSTVRFSASGKMADKLLDRDQLWEIQTPQALRRDLMDAGFDAVNREALTITDDVALAEHLGQPVALVTGSRRNLKITLPEDLTIAHALLTQDQEVTAP